MSYIRLLLLGKNFVSLYQNATATIVGVLWWHYHTEIYKSSIPWQQQYLCHPFSSVDEKPNDTSALEILFPRLKVLNR